MIERIGQLAVLMCMMGPGIATVFGQSEVSGWGNLRGIRVDDQLVPFTTAVGIYNTDFTQLTLSQREGPTRTTRYVRDGNTVDVGITLQYGGRGGRGARGPATNPAPSGSVAYNITYNDIAPGICDVHVQLTSPVSQAFEGVYYFLTLPAADFPNATARLAGNSNAAETPLTAANENGRFFAGKGSGIRISAGKRSIEATFPSPLDVVVQQTRGRNNNNSSDLQVYFPIHPGAITAGETMESTFTLKVTADADTAPVTVTVDPSKTGRTFDGIGGNYRIQNARLDPLHIQYIFDNMRVAYGRVAMPWNTWQPQEGAPPSTQPSGGRGGAMNSVQSAMEMAQTLAKKNIPMIISCWSPPQWATLPNGNGNGNGNARGQRLDPAKWDEICQSIGSYLLHLRDHYGAEPLLFSFNESNAGINVRQSPEEHAEAIKRLGAHFKAIGLKTRMLLGDTGDVPPVNFIQPAMNDPQAVQYIGAVSFHSWRGATDEQYQRWADAATQLNIPLLDAEGGNDAQAYSYPNLFREEWYALDEAAEYVRILRICQPQSILQWQLTENYSVLSSDPNNVLQPTQRFFNLKQLNLTPAGSAWIDARSSSPSVLTAAFAHTTTGMHSMHLLNNSASRAVTIKGLPGNVKRLNVYVTDRTRGMTSLGAVQVTNGSFDLNLPARALISLISGNP